MKQRFLYSQHLSALSTVGCKSGTTAKRNGAQALFGFLFFGVVPSVTAIVAASHSSCFTAEFAEDFVFVEDFVEAGGGLPGRRERTKKSTMIANKPQMLTWIRRSFTCADGAGT